MRESDKMDSEMYKRQEMRDERRDERYEKRCRKRKSERKNSRNENLGDSYTFYLHGHTLVGVYKLWCSHNDYIHLL